MNHDTIALNAQQEELLTQLAQSHARVLLLAYEGKLDLEKLRQLADGEANLTTLLHPMPLDPSDHVLAAHAYVHPYLERLVHHDPARVVVVDETHRYTPRKILRRVLDHALDHLNQIDQWLAWQRLGAVPTPTDGWATSDETFREDQQPLSPEELQSWLWRIDLTIGMLGQRARLLSTEQLDWQPPNEGWTLRHTLRHLARAEIFYSIWLDEPLPGEPIARYREANSRFEQHLRPLLSQPLKKDTALFDPQTDYTTITAEQVAQKVLERERVLLNT